jgi:tetratricopeptide (TPR) repeat protein
VERRDGDADHADFSKYLTLNAQDHDAWHRRGLVRFQIGAWEEASADFRKALELDPASAVYWLSRHAAHAQQGQQDQALESWNQVVKHSPFVQVRGDSRAVALAEKAVAVSPMYGNINTLGTVLYRAGRFEEAIRKLQEGMKLHGQNGNAWDWLFLAMAHHRLGHASEARQWLNRAIDWMAQFEAGKVKDAFYGITLNWNLRLELQLFRREAEALIK